MKDESTCRTNYVTSQLVTCIPCIHQILMTSDHDHAHQWCPQHWSVEDINDDPG